MRPIKALKKQALFSLLPSSSRHSQVPSRNTQAAPAREAGRLAPEFYFFFFCHSFKSNSLVSSPPLQQNISLSALQFTSLVDPTDLPLITSLPQLFALSHLPAPADTLCEHGRIPGRTALLLPLLPIKSPPLIIFPTLQQNSGGSIHPPCLDTEQVCAILI